MSPRESERRNRNLAKLAKHGKMHLFYWLVNTLLIIEDRGIVQAEIAQRAGKSRVWLETTLRADPKLSDAGIERNLLIIDHLITVITDERNAA
jgi:hypothetical protein